MVEKGFVNIIAERKNLCVIYRFDDEETYLRFCEAAMNDIGGNDGEWKVEF